MIMCRFSKRLRSITQALLEKDPKLIHTAMITLMVLSDEPLNR